MAGVGDQLLAGARLAADQQRRVDLRHPRRARLEPADRRRIAEDRLEAAGVVVLQRAQPLADAMRRVQRDHRAGHLAAGFAQRHALAQVRLAAELQLADRRALAAADERVDQRAVAQQIAQRRAGEPRLGQPAGRHRRGVGDDDGAVGIDGEHRVGLRGEQRVQVQPPPRAGQHAERIHREHAGDLAQLGAQLLESARIERWCLDVDMRRLHLDGRHVQRAVGELGKDFLRDADTVGNLDIDAHPGVSIG